MANIPLPSIQDMDININDIYEGVIHTRRVIGEVNKEVVQNNQAVQEIKHMLQGLSVTVENVQRSQHQLVRVSSSQQQSNNRQSNNSGHSIPETDTTFSLHQTRREEIQHILEASNNVLGTGGFGTVRYGLLNGQKVAVKVLNRHTQEVNEELIHELQMMHCYPAENILPLITYCLEPPCLVFQFMENGTLNIKLKDHMHPLNWRQRSNIAVGIARGLHHLHGNNIVHGDIKGQNILLDRHLEPKIGDFGTTKLLYNVSGKETTCLTNVANVSGTPYYLPNWFIEQTKGGKAVRKAIDVYSFGIILFEITSGMLPSDKDTQGRTLRVFVNKHIVYHAEIPQEYIASVDRDNIWFNIPTTEGVLTSNWPTFLYDVVKACTTDPTEANPTPWRKMPTIEYIHQQLNSCFILYLQTLGEQPLEVITAGEKDEVAKTVRDGFARRMES